jgi:hypothetical protein
MAQKHALNCEILYRHGLKYRKRAILYMYDRYDTFSDHYDQSGQRPVSSGLRQIFEMGGLHFV